MKTLKQIKQEVLNELRAIPEYEAFASKLPLLIENAIKHIPVDQIVDRYTEIQANDLKSKIHNEFIKSLQFSGSAPDFFDEAPIEWLTNSDFRSYIPAALKLLLNNTTQVTYTKEINTKAFNHDTADKFEIARMTINSALFSLYKLLMTEKNEHMEWLLIVNRSVLLSFYVFMQPTASEAIMIPIKIGDKWQLIEYQVCPILLDDRDENEVFFAERIYAYGLVPKQEGLTPFLVFRGTPPTPFYEGHHAARAADCHPGKSVGQILIEKGYINLKSWFESLSNFGKVHLTGHSLGGSLSLLCDLAFSEHISTVDAFNPTGPYQETFNLHPFSDYNPSDDKQVSVYKNEGDIVSSLGYWHPSWKVFGICVKKPTTKTLAHVVNLLGQSDIVVYKCNIGHDNEKTSRKIVTYLHQSTSNITFGLLSAVSRVKGQSSTSPVTKINITYPDKMPFAEKLDLLTNTLNELKIDLNTSKETLKEIFGEFIADHIVNYDDAYTFIKAIGVGNGGERGKNIFLSHIRTMSRHDLFNFSSGPTYGETDLSKFIAEKVHNKILMIIHRQNYIIAKEDLSTIVSIFNSEKTTPSSKQFFREVHGRLKILSKPRLLDKDEGCSSGTNPYDSPSPYFTG